MGNTYECTQAIKSVTGKNYMVGDEISSVEYSLLHWPESDVFKLKQPIMKEEQLSIKQESKSEMPDVVEWRGVNYIRSEKAQSLAIEFLVYILEKGKIKITPGSEDYFRTSLGVPTDMFQKYFFSTPQGANAVFIPSKVQESTPAPSEPQASLLPEYRIKMLIGELMATLESLIQYSIDITVKTQAGQRLQELKTEFNQ